jgi:hypothetical protein
MPVTRKKSGRPPRSVQPLSSPAPKAPFSPPPEMPSRSSSGSGAVGGRPRATSWRSTAATNSRWSAAWPAASVGKNRSFGRPTTVAALLRPRGTAASRVGREQAGRPAVSVPPAARAARERRNWDIGDLTTRRDA